MWYATSKARPERATIKYTLPKYEPPNYNEDVEMLDTEKYIFTDTNGKKEKIKEYRKIQDSKSPKRSRSPVRSRSKSKERIMAKRSPVRSPNKSKKELTKRANSPTRPQKESKTKSSAKKRSPSK